MARGSNVGFALDLNNRLDRCKLAVRAEIIPSSPSAFHDRKQAEAALRGALDGYRVPGTEWFNIHPEEAAGLLWAVARRNAIHRGQTAMPEKLTNKYEITQIKADE
ncbi:GIY-YIG nuclease family protein [Sinorhizobium meliloti]|uniref:GIY-YIG nuclease family protein n=1 Tax=Rhizobium meliloti TaxID=382 RepID=UPI0034E48AC9